MRLMAFMRKIQNENKQMRYMKRMCEVTIATLTTEKEDSSLSEKQKSYKEGQLSAYKDMLKRFGDVQHASMTNNQNIVYVAIEDVWGLAGRIVHHSEDLYQLETYIERSPSDLAVETLSKEEFEKAKANNWYIE